MRTQTAVTTVAAFAIVLAIGIPVSAAEQAALIEDVSGPATVRAMDYLSSGAVLRLRKTTTVSIGYLHSCIEEKITGGTVHIGSTQSTVENGKVVRHKVRCDSAMIALTPHQAAESGAFAVRAPATVTPLPSADLTIYGTRPIVRVRGGGTVTIARLDRASTMLGAGEPLVPGALYRVSSGDREIIVRVDAGARSSGVPVISRLIEF